MDVLHQEAGVIHESKQKLRDKMNSLEVELAKAASESETRPSPPDDKPVWKNFMQLAMETASTAEEFQRMCWQGTGIPTPAGNEYMADVAGTRGLELAVDEGLEELEAKRRKSLSQQTETEMATGSSLSLLLFFLVNRWLETSKMPVRVFGIQYNDECVGSPTQIVRQIIRLQECVPPPCVAPDQFVEIPEFNSAGFSMNFFPPGVARSQELSLSLVADGVVSVRIREVELSGDSLSLCSLCEVFSLFSEWMPVLSWDQAS